MDSGSVVVLCVTGILGLFGLFLVGMGGMVLRQGIKSRRWASVEGEVTYSEVVERRQVTARDETVRTEVSYEPVVEYRFTLREETLTRKQLGLSQRTYARPLAEKVAKRYPVGQKVTVYYNPANREETALEVGVGWSWLIFMLVGAGLVGAAVWMGMNIG